MAGRVTLVVVVSLAVIDMCLGVKQKDQKIFQDSKETWYNQLSKHSGRNSHHADAGHHQDIVEAAHELLLSIKNAKSNEEYERRLERYENFKHEHLNDGICLPKAVNFYGRIPSTGLTQSQKSCKEAYRIGWRHGRRWAKITLADGQPAKVGQDRIRCIINLVDPNSPDIKQVCSYLGAQAGFNSYYHSKRQPKENLKPTKQVSSKKSTFGANNNSTSSKKPYSSE